MPFSSVLGANSVVRPGVCTSTTRPTVPYEGQLIYETDTDRVASYNGSAWVYGSFTGGLVLISSTTIGNAVSSVTVSNAFGSAYDNYMITVQGGVSSANPNLQLTLGSTTTGYYGVYMYRQFNTTTMTNDFVNNGSMYAYAGAGTSSSLNGIVYISSPNLAKTTQFMSHAVEPRVGGYGYWGLGFLNDTTQYTSFALAPNTGTITGGTIRVYGYSNS